MGDGIQAAKAGILEIGDVFVVNKADRDGADATARELRHMISLAPSEQGAWRPPVLKIVATQGTGLAELVDAIGAHREWLESSGTGLLRRRQRARSEIQGIALATLQERFAGLGGDGALDTLADEVASGQLDAFTAADRIVASIAG
jgi:LAO/AO transport system kinase